MQSVLYGWRPKFVTLGEGPHRGFAFQLGCVPSTLACPASCFLSRDAAVIPPQLLLKRHKRELVRLDRTTAQPDRLQTAFQTVLALLPSGHTARIQQGQTGQFKGRLNGCGYDRRVCGRFIPLHKRNVDNLNRPKPVYHLDSERWQTGFQS